MCYLNLMKSEFMEQLNKLRNKVIIVEGIKDKKALEKYGIAKVIVLNKPIFQLCEALSEIEEVVILTDLDKEGKKLYSKIKENLTRNGIKIDDSFREFLFKNTELTQIEGLDSYLEDNHIN